MASSSSSSSTSSDLVTLFVHSPTTHVSSERRLPFNSSLSSLQSGPRGLEGITGLSPSQQRLQLWSTSTASGSSDARLLWDSADSTFGLDRERVTLASLGARDGMGLKVLDALGRMGDIGIEEEELAPEQRFEMTDEEYRARGDTVLAYKQRMKLGRFAPEAATAGESAGATAAAALDLPSLGARCEIQDATPPRRRGTVRYVGPVTFPSATFSASSASTPAQPSAQPWIGVELDEPLGKHDGAIAGPGGQRYFTCAAKHGAFVRVEKVKWGEEYAIRELEDELELTDEEGDEM